MTEVVDVDGLTSEWLSQALMREVELESCERIGTGQTAATYRLAVIATDLPRTIVAKVATGDEGARRRVSGGFLAEVGFYQVLQPTVAVRVPRCWYAAVSDDGLTFTLLLEDLAPRTPGVQVDGCSVSRAEAAMIDLAALHAPRWNDPSLFAHSFLQRTTAEGATFLGSITESATAVFIDRYRSELAIQDQDTLQTAAAAVESWLLSKLKPFGILHGDYRLDNLMFGADSDDVVAVDWQTAMVGLPGRDAAYFLGTSLDVATRQQHEGELVAAYHEQLVERGVSDYSAQECFEDYRRGALQGPLITTIGAAFATAERTAESDEMFLAMARRSCAAIRDLNSLELL